ncbi:MAG TPA: class I SAM-dependent methyltransferase [Bacteroidia bacterium]
MKSPITNSNNVVLERTLSAGEIIVSYAKAYNIDISNIFKGVDLIYIYKCLDTGYRFYYPFHISGDGNFYSQLQKFDWYYMPWKWEHEIAKKIIRQNERVLEIGCAKGDFIRELSETGVSCLGLELNNAAIKEGVAKGVNILNESIQDHAKNRQLFYDVVCSFQVAEHVADVRSFIQSSVDALKPGGRLIISVPNMTSFYKFFEQTNMNVPPHHMGLWDEESLKTLESFFSIKFLKYYFEPLQTYHVELYASVMANKYNIDKYSFIGKFIHRYLSQWYKFIGNRYGNKVKGLTMVAVFEKKQTN